MGLVISMVAAVAVGFLGHRTRPTLRRDFQGGWFPVSCYVVGVLLTLPFVILIDYNLRDASRKARLLAAYLLAFLGVGSGVVAGHYIGGNDK